MKVFKKLMAGIAFCLLATSQSHACTGIKIQAKDGSQISGRTLEFGVKIDASIVVVPRGFAFTSTTPQGPGLAYKAKYAAVGAVAFNQPAVMDGLNEKGLAIGTFYFPGFAGYAKITKENQADALSPVEFPNWILTQFATVDEVKKGLSDIVIAPTIVKAWGETPPPFHYLVIDKSGKGLVIEPINGKLVVYENNIGVFTNSPTFDWHMTNLRNYINLTPISVKPLKIGGYTFAPFGQGSGMVGLPGDFTPPSRFVRAAIFTVAAIPAQDAQGAVAQTFHILNQFDIPVGAAVEKVEGIVYSDYTQLTAVRDPQALKYYFKTYDDQTIRFVDLKKFDLDAKNVRYINAADFKQTMVNVSDDLK